MRVGGDQAHTSQAALHQAAEQRGPELDGVNIEAQTYTSTLTDENNGWVGEAQSYGQSYATPVVLGQVMTENDPAWSVFCGKEK